MLHTAAVSTVAHAVRAHTLSDHPDVSMQRARPAAAQLPHPGLCEPLCESDAGAALAHRFLLSHAKPECFCIVLLVCLDELNYSSTILSWQMLLMPLQ